jgi:hypothetical protein
MFQFLKPFLSAILKWGSIVGASLLILLKTRESGEKAIENKEAAEVLKGVQIHDKIENDIADSNNVELERLRKKFDRD